MYSRNIFDNISPLDHRYSLPGEEFAEYAEFLSEKARIKYQARVEGALVKVLARRGICSQEVAREIQAAIEQITPEEVYEEELKTRHDIRALVNCIQRKVSPAARPYVHFTTTSFDIVDTANSLRFRKVSEKLLLPKLYELEKLLMEIALREKDTLQIGRTHGQHAVPITFGFAMAEYVSRLGNRIREVREKSQKLVGKIAGAVGAYNASYLFFADPEEFEKEVLAELGLEPGPVSTQIVEPEPMTDFIHALVSCFGVLANLSDDMRHLQRSEIGEVGEYFAAEQVGSSTMPHKRNPINYENVKSLWKKFMPGMVTVYMDQISEHQRDLTNSASARFLPEIAAGLLMAVQRLQRVLGRMQVDKENLRKNFDLSKEMIVAEPLYILLASHGHPDAHEAVRRLTLEAEQKGVPLRELLQEKEELKAYWERFTEKQRDLLLNPECYTGIAADKTVRVVEYWKEELGI